MNPLPTYINLMKPHFESKGWHVVHYDHYIGLTGYLKDKGGDKAPLPRPQHIVSLCYFQPLSAEGEIKKMMWEVKTHWTVKRQLFTEFEPAYELFVEEEKKYDPKKLNWASLGNINKKNS